MVNRPAAQRDPSARLTHWNKASYAIGDVADGIQGAVVNTFLLFYLTSACGMAGSLAGLALAITLVIEAVTTPVFGYLSDRTRTKWGRRHPYMLLAAIPLAFSIGLIFSVPEFASPWATFAYVLVVLIVLRGSFSAFALPYAALGAELSAGATPALPPWLTASVVTPEWVAMSILTSAASPPARAALRSPLSTEAKGSLSFHSGCCGASTETRWSAKSSWKYIGCSAQSVPSLSKVAIRSAGGTKSGEPAFVTRSTNATMAFFGALSFQDGRGSWA